MSGGFFPQKLRNRVQGSCRKISIHTVAVKLMVEFHSCQYFQKVLTECVRCRGHKLCFFYNGSSAKNLHGKNYEPAFNEQRAEEVHGRTLYHTEKKA